MRPEIIQMTMMSSKRRLPTQQQQQQQQQQQRDQSNNKPGGRFPDLLYHAIQDAQRNPHLASIICWADNNITHQNQSDRNNKFIVYNTDDFMTEISPAFFPNNSSFRSIERLINQWQFQRHSDEERVTFPRDDRKAMSKRRIYSHPNFIPNQPSLLKSMTRRRQGYRASDVAAAVSAAAATAAAAVTATATTGRQEHNQQYPMGITSMTNNMPASSSSYAFDWPTHHSMMAADSKKPIVASFAGTNEMTVPMRTTGLDFLMTDIITTNSEPRPSMPTSSSRLLIPQNLFYHGNHHHHHHHDDDDSTSIRGVAFPSPTKQRQTEPRCDGPGSRFHHHNHHHRHHESSKFTDDRVGSMMQRQYHHTSYANIDDGTEQVVNNNATTEKDDAKWMSDDYIGGASTVAGRDDHQEEENARNSKPSFGAHQHYYHHQQLEDDNRTTATGPGNTQAVDEQDLDSVDDLVI